MTVLPRRGYYACTCTHRHDEGEHSCAIWVRACRVVARVQKALPTSRIKIMVITKARISTARVAGRTRFISLYRAGTSMDSTQQQLLGPVSAAASR